MRRIEKTAFSGLKTLMKIVENILRDWRWPVAAVLASATILAIAHAFEVFGDLPPCPLCLRQREVYWAAIFMSLTGLALWRWMPRRRFLIALNVMIGLVFGVGIIVAFYHSGVEWGVFPPPDGCAGGGEVDPFAVMDLNQKFNMTSCTDAPFYVLGLSMAGWNGVVSAALALASFIAAAATFRGR